jgi:beta-glucanase (GH16 family)
MRFPTVISFVYLFSLLGAVEDGASPPVPPAGQRWVAIPALSDEFNATELDSTRWMPRHAYWKGREPSRFSEDNVSLGDGMLRLRSTADPGLLAQAKNPEKDVWVQAACISSQGPLAHYGYYAARIKASRLSMTSSFWLQGKFSEIDVVEQFGASARYPEKGRMMLSCTHYFPHGWATDKAIPTTWEMPSGAADAFHVYGVWWKDPRTIWLYHDGNKVGEMIPPADFDEKFYVFFDTEVFTWHGLPTVESLNDPQRNTMLVDWVRSWRLEGKAP